MEFGLVCLVHLLDGKKRASFLFTRFCLQVLYALYQYITITNYYISTTACLLIVQQLKHRRLRSLAAMEPDDWIVLACVVRHVVIVVDEFFFSLPA